MDVEAAITAYTELAKVVFTPRKRNIFGGHFLHKVLGNATFDGKALETAVKDVVRKALGDENENAALRQNNPKCRM